VSAESGGSAKAALYMYNHALNRYNNRKMKGNKTEGKQAIQRD
jgi:hypothetical protein